MNTIEKLELKAQRTKAQEMLSRHEEYLRDLDIQRNAVYDNMENIKDLISKIESMEKGQIIDITI